MLDVDPSDDLTDLLSEVLVRFLAIFCTCISVLSVFTGLPAIKLIKQQGHVKKFKFLPYLTGMIYNLIWFYYGLLKLDWTVMISHTMGCTMQTFYMLVYIQYSKPPPLLQICVGWMVLFSGWFHLNMVIGTREAVISRLGFVGALSLAVVHLAQLFEYLNSACLQKQFEKDKIEKDKVGGVDMVSSGVGSGNVDGNGWKRVLKQNLYYMPSMYRRTIQKLQIVNKNEK